MSESPTINIKGCSSCGIDHDNIEVFPLHISRLGTRPTIDGAPVTGWAMCPANRCPVLIAPADPLMDAIKRLPFQRALEVAKELVDTWLCEIHRGRRGYVRWEPVQADGGIMEYRAVFCTAMVQYSIRVRPDYVGAYMRMRKARAGEDWLRGVDLPDGPLSKETWEAIRAAIFHCEVVQLAAVIEPGKTFDFDSVIAEARGQPIQRWAERKLPSFDPKDDGKPRCTHETGVECDLLQKEGCRPQPLTQPADPL